MFWLQSVDDGSVMFPVVSPEALDIEYQIELGDEDCALIDLKNSDDVAVVGRLFTAMRRRAGKLPRIRARPSSSI